MRLRRTRTFQRPQLCFHAQRPALCHKSTVQSRDNSRYRCYITSRSCVYSTAIDSIRPARPRLSRAGLRCFEQKGIESKQASIVLNPGVSPMSTRRNKHSIHKHRHPTERRTWPPAFGTACSAMSGSISFQRCIHRLVFVGVVVSGGHPTRTLERLETPAEVILTLGILPNDEC